MTPKQDPTLPPAAAPGSAGAIQGIGKNGARQGKTRALHEFVRFAIIFAYLWAMFLLFQIHEYVVLAEHQISFAKYGFGMVNALVLAKVMLVADDFRFGVWLRSGPLIYAIMLRSVAFAALFVVVDIGEKLLVGAFHGAGLIESLPTYGGGGLFGSILVGIIISFALVPFFAVEEINIVPGPGKLAGMLLSRGGAPK